MSFPRVKRRKRFFLGCEGKSEVAYVRAVEEIAKGEELPVTFDVSQFDGGDPSVIAASAISSVAEKESEIDPFRAKILILDRDRLDEKNAQDSDRIVKLLKENDFITIWQQPDHEGFLLRHVDGYQDKRPPRGQPLKVLQKAWPGYEKGMTRRDYTKKITLNDLKRAVDEHPELKSFLQAIGLITLEG